VTGTEVNMAMVAAVLVGLVVGSFLNVCIHRLPLGESVVAPRSRCPACRTTIRALENIPIVSYLALRGRCRTCGARISPRYPLVEALAAGCCVAAVAAFGPTLRAALAAGFLCLLVAATFVDLDHMLIPHALTLPWIPVALVGALLGAGPPLPDALIGALAGAGFVDLVGAYAEVFINWGVEREEDFKAAMGFGDVTLTAMMGAFLGWRALIVAFFIATLVGSIVGLARIALGRLAWGKHLPFGPFLALGGASTLFVGERILRWYLGLLRPGG
jgi:leader peptidase (prepilin peptidase)/N-methyltransferase